MRVLQMQQVGWQVSWINSQVLSPKTKKIPAGRLVFGDWLGHLRVSTAVGCT